MSDNPFGENPPSPDDPQPIAFPTIKAPVTKSIVSTKLAKEKVWLPSMALVVLSGLSLVYYFNQLPKMIFVDAAREFEKDSMGGIGFVAGTIALVGYQVIVVFCAALTIQLTSYTAARVAAFMSLVPFCGPGFGLSIPFAIWALVVLNKSEIRQAFEQMEATRLQRAKAPN